MKRIVIVIIATLLLFGCVGCANNDVYAEEKAQQNKILSKISNKPSEELITYEVGIDAVAVAMNAWVRISKGELIFGYYAPSLNEVNRQFGIECLRKNGDALYSVHKGTTGEPIYIIYELDTNTGLWMVKDCYVNVYDIKDIQAIAIQGSTLDEILELDAYERGRFSIDCRWEELVIHFAGESFDSEESNKHYQEMILKYETKHLTNEGVLTITYLRGVGVNNAETDPAKITVENVSVSNDIIAILEQDLPKQE